jgi:hypothetical protein
MSSDLISWAAALTMPSGRYYGRRLGELVHEVPDYVEWISRAWRDAGVRAAATVLLDRVAAGFAGELAGDLLARAVAAARSSEAA